MKKQLDGCCTRMLRMALNVSWKQHITNIQLYGELPPVSTKVQQRRMRLAGHCVRHGDEVANKLVLWQPTDGHANREVYLEQKQLLLRKFRISLPPLIEVICRVEFALIAEESFRLLRATRHEIGSTA